MEAMCGNILDLLSLKTLQSLNGWIIKNIIKNHDL